MPSLRLLNIETLVKRGLGKKLEFDYTIKSFEIKALTREAASYWVVA